MSYKMLSRSIGSMEPVGAVALVGGDDVYVWRATLSYPIDSPNDALLIAQAVGRHMRKREAWNVVGVCVHDDYAVDVVLRPRASSVFFATATSGLVESVQGDPDVQARWPILSVSGVLLQITAPEQALDFWRSRNTLYDALVGPKQEFVEGRGVYRGTADQGANLEQWESEKSPLVPKLTNGEEDHSIGTVGWVAIAAISGFALWAGWKVVSAT